MDLAHRHITFNPSKFELSLWLPEMEGGWGGVTNRETYRQTEMQKQMGKISMGGV